MTLYRKYRPQKIADLDIEEVRDRLGRILSSSYKPHALLFTGPKGTGKTSAARIVAKVLNCLQLTNDQRPTTSDKSNIEPCDKCENCIAISEGRFLDVLEIDAASNRGIDEMRDLREKIKLSPVGGKMKVYIIDEVHMLTNEAFNAILKTLEEPPSHAVFILATTEVEKLPSTITSRCINFNFHKATDKEIVHCLKRVARGEKIEVTDEFLETIAHVSDGAFRDATKILEQAIIENAFTPEKLNKLVGKNTSGGENLLKLLSKKETNEILKYIHEMSENGVSIRFFVEDILSCLHKILLTQHGIEENADKELAKIFSEKDVLALIKLFSKVFSEMKFAYKSEIPLELAVVEWCENK